MTVDENSNIDPRLQAAAYEGCEESRLMITRRSMMGLTAGFFAANFIPTSALASSTDKRVLFVILRGGMDGLHVAMPVGDPGFIRARELFLERLREPKVTLNSTSHYALHPALKKFGAMFNSNQAAIIQAIAPPLRERSHFACQYNLESGMGPTNTPVVDGWLNRLLQRLPVLDPVRASGAVGIGGMPLILTGTAPVRSWSLLEYISHLPSNYHQTLYDYYDASFSRPTNPGVLLKRAIDTNAQAMSVALRTFDERNCDSSIMSVRKTFRGAARLMSCANGPRIGVLSVDGWDTHISENVNTGIAQRLAMLDWGIDDFRIQMGGLWNNTLVVCVSEFGRTIELNGTSAEGSGTEHGIGTVALLAGGAFRGAGRVLGETPDIADVLSKPVEEVRMGGRHDVPATTDTRQLFKSVIEDYLQVSGVDLSGERGIFPNSQRLGKIAGLFG